RRGLEDEPERVGVGALRDETGLATDLSVDLCGRVREDVAVLWRGYAGALTLRQRQGRNRSPARIRRATGAYDRRLEQLVEVRCTHGTVIAAAEAHRLNRPVLQAELVGVGGDVVDRVARVPIARIHRKQIGARLVVDERETHLRERLPHPVPAVDRPGRRAAGLEAVGEDVIRLEVVVLRAV